MEAGARRLAARQGVCGLALVVRKARMPLRGRRLGSEGLTGSGWHWSTPRTF
nr:MAG TPA: hypothetical protein [Caudoviricetes sp.]